MGIWERFQMTGKTALIAGGSRGLGKEWARPWPKRARESSSARAMRKRRAARQKRCNRPMASPAGLWM